MTSKKPMKVLKSHGGIGRMKMKMIHLDIKGIEPKMTFLKTQKME
jgi:hypothetical protein